MWQLLPAEGAQASHLSNGKFLSELKLECDRIVVLLASSAASKWGFYNFFFWMSELVAVKFDLFFPPLPILETNCCVSGENLSKRNYPSLLLLRNEA